MNETEQNNVNNIDSDEWAQVLTLFDQLSEVSVVERTVHLDELEISDAAQQMLEKMLAAQHEPNILDHTIDPFVEELLGTEAVSERFNPVDIINRSFGAWEVVDELAKGGMGQVFVAQRADGEFEKKVAIKVIKSGYFSELTQQRFKAEMQTLAQFEHPHIARLIDGGTSDDGIAYIVMELVEGSPICDYAASQALSLSARIDLVLQAIEAVEYAHQNLIIHGDIKPANLLVNETGQVKLVDFGIARPFQEESGVAYLPQFTPSYSSPEQAKGKSLSMASDVFGLCAVLYELCSGHSPRERESVTTHVEYTQQLNTPIKNVFQRYKTIASAVDKDVLQGHDAKEFTKALSQELGTIIDKGLQIEIKARYKNTTELRSDLQLFIQGSVVPNHASNLMYRWRKVWQKNSMLMATSVMAVLGIVTFAVIAMNQARIAEQEAEKAQWSNQFLLSIFTEADPVKNQLQPITVNELTAVAAEKILVDEIDLELKTDSLGLLSQIQYRLGEVKSAEKLGLEQIKLLNNLPTSKQQLAAAHISTGTTMEAQDKLDDSVYHFRQAMKFAPFTEAVNEQSIRAAMSLVNSLIRLNEVDEAGQILLALAEQEPAILRLPASNSLLAALNALKAKLSLSVPDFKQALQQLETAKAYALKVSDEPMLYPQILGIESDTYFNSGKGEKAAEIDRELVDYFSKNFGEGHPETIDNLGRLAVSLATLGELQAGIEINQKIISNLKGTEIKGHQLPAAYLNMGTAYQALGDHQKALENYKQAQKLWPDLEPSIPLYEASTDVKTASSLLALKAYADAQQHFDRALFTIKQEMGDTHPLYARFQIMYSALLIEQGRLEEAHSVIPAAYQVIVGAYGENSKRTAAANLRWAQLNAASGDAVTAAKQAESVIRILDVPGLRKRNAAAIELAKKLIE